MKVLITDSRSEAANSLADLVRKCGHEAVAVTEEPAALETARSWRPDCVFVEVGQPELDGYVLAKRLREEAGLSRATLVAVSEFSEDRSRENAAGFNCYVRRPLQSQDVQSLLSSHFT